MNGEWEQRSPPWEKEKQEEICDKILLCPSAISLDPRTLPELGPCSTPTEYIKLVLREVLGMWLWRRFLTSVGSSRCGSQTSHGSTLVRNTYSQACPHTPKSETLGAAAGPSHRRYPPPQGC